MNREKHLVSWHLLVPDSLNAQVEEAIKKVIAEDRTSFVIRAVKEALETAEFLEANRYRPYSPSAIKYREEKQQ